MFLTCAGVCLLWGSGFAVEPPPGTWLGPDNIAQYKQYIPNQKVIEGIEKGDRIQVVDLKELGLSIDAPKHFLDATLKFGPDCKIGPDGGLVNYRGGFPFTEDEIKEETDLDKKALMVAWNLDMRWFGDQFTSIDVPGAEDSFVPYGYTEKMKRDQQFVRRICGNKHGEEVISDVRIDRINSMGRILLDPKPNMPGREGIIRTMMYAIHNPRDVAGQFALYYVYFDAKKNDDLWIYVPSIRRVKRMPTSQRSATRSPTDSTWDDATGWSGKVASFNWKFVKEDRILGLVAKTNDYLLHRQGSAYPNPQDLWFSMEDVYVLEHSCKDPSYAIAKRMFWIRNKGYQTIYNRLYNKRGELWRVYAEPPRPSENFRTGEKGGLVATAFYWDLPRQHQTFLYAPCVSINIPVDPQRHTIKFMYSGMRGQK
jgi:hypothetical protein